MRICIDPGHGSPDSGATNENLSLHEKDFAYSMAQVFGSLCEHKGHEILFTRKGDFNVSERASTQKANAWEADVYISIHSNGFSDASVNGFEVLYWETSESGERLADTIHSRSEKVGFHRAYRGSKGRGVSDRGATVLSQTNMPAVIVEYGFMTNDEDAVYIFDKDHQILMAHSLLLAVEEWQNNR